MRIYDMIVNFSEYAVLTKTQFIRYINIIVDNLIFINTYNLIDESIILLIPNAEDYPYQIQIDSYYKIIKGVISLG